MTSHPYSNLPEIAFWKKGVAELSPLSIDLSWHPKFAITRTTGIITLGSCFAQHISKSLKKNGFNWLDSEPAPSALPPAQHEKNGYGVFSFRTGNIYSAALLRQWINWALGGEQSEDYFQDGNRCYDPFRPTLNQTGFATTGEMRAARDTTLGAMRQTLLQADLFIFTLGLTETWLNKNGTVYPMCPGTVRGVFNPDQHIFHNYDYAEIVRDLGQVFDSLRNVNPKLRFLLTVSPVPLTATAAGEHVLTATTYSKSVLRAVAGFLAKTREDTDYFPSYEIITAPPFKGQFFEDNMRSVKPDGVSFVMRQFLNALGIEQEQIVSTAPNSATSASQKIVDSEICDDILLETWSAQNRAQSGQPSTLVLIGDSHMGKMALMLVEQGIHYAGGGTMNASDWQACRFDESADYLFMPHNAEQKQQWITTYQSSLAHCALSQQSPLVIMNMGMQRNEAAIAFLNEYVPLMFGPSYTGNIRNESVLAYLMQARKIHIKLVYQMLARGYQIVFVSDPPVEPPQLTSICALIDKFLTEYYGSIGCQVFNAREWIAEKGGLPDAFRADEAIHGSDEYYRQLTQAVINRYAIANFRSVKPGNG
jgi:hypothetical protein